MNTSQSPRKLRQRLILSSISLLLAAGLLYGQEGAGAERAPASSAGEASGSTIRTGPYCGVSCLYAAMRLAGHQISFSDLLRPEYIESHKGSSLIALKKAAEANGFHAIPLKACDSLLLRHCPAPVVLRVKSEVGKNVYDHYVLFLGTHDGDAQILDPPNPARSVPFRQLAPVWDGCGLVVSATPLDLHELLAPARKRLIWWTAGSVALVGLIRRAGRSMPSTPPRTWRAHVTLSLVQLAGLAVVTSFSGLVYHLSHDAGLLANPAATTDVQHAHAASFIPKVSREKVRRLLGSETVFIDARLTRDYRAGHLDGAINVPVDANDVQHRGTTAPIPKDARVIVYCQSKACRFAETVALKMKDDGFSNVAVYRGGWADWVAGNARTGAGAEP